MTNTLRALARVLIGLVFIFSGFVKIIDPTGGAVVITEYLKAFHLPFLTFLSDPAATLLAITELMTGIAVLTGLRMSLAIKIALGFMLFFTPLTLILALFNPVSDCGCFGEAIKLTNWQTFYKNLVLLIAAFFLFRQRRAFIPIAQVKWEWSFLGVYLIAAASLSLYSHNRVPLIDFMQFKSGEQLYYSDDEQGDNKVEFVTTLIYEKNGKKEEFTMDNLPDSSWTFVDSKSVMSKAGQKSSDKLIFAISDREGSYVTDSIIGRYRGATFLTIVQDVRKLTPDKISKIKEFTDSIATKRARHIIVTGSEISLTDSLFSVNGIKSEIYFSDYKTLITLNRSNGGVVFVFDNEVIKKWSVNRLPAKRLGQLLTRDPELLSAEVLIREHIAAEFAFLAIILLIIFMRFFCKWFYIHKLVQYADLGEEKSKE